MRRNKSNLPPLIKMSVLGPVKLVVFDFDCTITSVHTCPNMTPEQLESMSLDRVVDVVKFRAFVDYLLRSNTNVAIASYGRKDLILSIMGQIFRDTNPFNALNVITPLDVSTRWAECNL